MGRGAQSLVRAKPMEPQILAERNALVPGCQGHGVAAEGVLSRALLLPFVSGVGGGGGRCAVEAS